MIIISGGEIITAIVVIVSVAFGIKYLIRLLNKKSNHIPKAVWETSLERFAIRTRLHKRMFRAEEFPTESFDVGIVAKDTTPEEYLHYFLKGLEYPKNLIVSDTITHIGGLRSYFDLNVNGCPAEFWIETRTKFFVELHLRFKEYAHNPNDYPMADPIKEIVDRARGVSKENNAIEYYGYKWRHL